MNDINKSNIILHLMKIEKNVNCMHIFYLQCLCVTKHNEYENKQHIAEVNQ